MKCGALQRTVQAKRAEGEELSHAAKWYRLTLWLGVCVHVSMACNENAHDTRKTERPSEHRERHKLLCANGRAQSIEQSDRPQSLCAGCCVCVCVYSVFICGDAKVCGACMFAFADDACSLALHLYNVHSLYVRNVFMCVVFAL